MYFQNIYSYLEAINSFEAMRKNPTCGSKVRCTIKTDTTCLFYYIRLTGGDKMGRIKSEAESDVAYHVWNFCVNVGGQ